MTETENGEHLRRRPNWNSRPRAERLIAIHRWDEAPPNMTESEEDEFWRTHALGDELFDDAGPPDADEVELLDRIRRQRAKRRHDRAAG
jgi:hypothetical protein